MSLLSDAQGRPHTLRALISTIQSLGGSVSDADLARWMLPRGTGGATSFPSDSSRLKQTLGCARSLGWLSSRGDRHTLLKEDILSRTAAFWDALHQTLCTTDKDEDRRILEAYAVVVLKTEKEQSTNWLKEWNQKDLADFIDKSLRSDRGGDASDTDEKNRLFNPTKMAPWLEWISAVGLGWKSDTLNQFLPDPTPRLLRELHELSAELGVDQEIDPQAFLAALGRRLPYLDGGPLFEDIRRRMGFAPLPVDQVSLVLGRALLTLEEEKMLKLISRGDAATRGFTIPSIEIQNRKARYIVSVTLHGGLKR